MGRNVVTPGTPDRSFAGMMDHLTGYGQEGASEAGSEYGATFRRNSKPDSAAGDGSPANPEVVAANLDGSLTNVRLGVRPLPLPTPVRPGQGAAEVAELSYEQAMRIHSRRRSPPAPRPSSTASTAAAAAVPPAIAESREQRAASPSLGDAAGGTRNAAANGKASSSQPQTRAASPAAPALGRRGERSATQNPRAAKTLTASQIEPPQTPSAPVQAAPVQAARVQAAALKSSQMGDGAVPRSAPRGAEARSRSTAEDETGSAITAAAPSERGGKPGLSGRSTGETPAAMAVRLVAERSAANRQGLESRRNARSAGNILGDGLRETSVAPLAPKKSAGIVAMRERLQELFEPKESSTEWMETEFTGVDAT